MTDVVLGTIGSDPLVALTWSGRLVGLAIIMHGFQTCVSLTEAGPGGPLDIRLSKLMGMTRLDRFTWRALDETNVKPSTLFGCVGILQCFVGTLLIIAPSWWALYLLAFIIGIVASTSQRLGVDGADDLLRVLTAALAIGWLFADSDVGAASAAIFIAAIVSLAYLTAGLSKAQSMMWWSGVGLQAVVGTQYFGIRGAHRLPPFLFTVSSWGIVLWESFFPLALLGPFPLTLFMVTLAVTFHFICGIVMGLDGFLFVFTAAQPCVLFTAVLVSNHVDIVGRAVIMAVYAVLVAAWFGFWIGRESQASIGMPTSSTPLT